jgi:hypothetical protein
MPTPEQIEQHVRELLEKSPPPAWLIEMIVHYQKTGTFRPQDLQRLMGDVSKGVMISPDTTVEGVLSQGY